MARVKYDFAKFEINSGIHTRKLDFGICHTPIGYPFPIIGLFVCCGNDSHCSGETQASKQGVIWLKPVGGSNVTARVFLPLAAKRPHLRLGGLGERLSSPSGSRRSPAAKRLLVHLELKIKCMAMMILNKLLLVDVK